MVNFSDGKSDGLVLMYVKDGKVYPVLVLQSELEVLDATIPTMLTKVAPVLDQCLGKISPIANTVGDMKNKEELAND